MSNIEKSISQLNKYELNELADAMLAELSKPTSTDSTATLSAEDQTIWERITSDLNHEITTVTTQTEFSDVVGLLDRYANSPTFKQGRKEAEKILAKANTIDCFTGKISFQNPDLNQHFEIRQPKITAVIDFIKLEVKTGDHYQFKRPQVAFLEVQNFLDTQGIVKKNNDGTGGAYVQHSKTNIRSFTFSIHDVKSGEQFNQALKLLHAEYSPKSIKIVGVELSLDFWHLPPNPLLLELSKTVRADINTERKDFRAYKNKHEFGEMPSTTLSAVSKIEKGFAIGIGHRDKGNEYKRFYYKTRDSGKALPIDQHRPRAEVNLRGSLLSGISNNTADLRKIITDGFKHLQFTRLNTDKATKADARQFHNKIDLYGKETEITSKNRNKRSLPEYMKTNADLNRAINKSVQNLARNFSS